MSRRWSYEREREVSWIVVLLKVFVVLGSLSTLAVGALIALLILKALLGK